MPYRNAWQLLIYMFMDARRGYLFNINIMAYFKAEILSPCSEKCNFAFISQNHSSIKKFKNSLEDARTAHNYLIST